jgi:hypothetical protein
MDYVDGRGMEHGQTSPAYTKTLFAINDFKTGYLSISEQKDSTLI